MEKLIESQTGTVVSVDDLIAHWLGHRSLTRRVIDAFPEKELFEFSIGGMRTFAEIVQELLAIAVPGLKEIAGEGPAILNEHIEAATSKANILKLWDEATSEVEKYMRIIPQDKFHEEILSFGRYPGTVQSSIFYFIDNEIHHRAQGYVFLRALGIEPPPFWDRN